MKRRLFWLLIISLVLFAPMPTSVLGEDDEDGPNLDIPEDLDEKAKEYLEEGIKTYKEMKKRSENAFKEAYKRPTLRLKDSDKRKKKIDKLIKLFQKAAKAAPKSHLPPFYLCIMYQWKSGAEGGSKFLRAKAKSQGEKAMKLLDNFYEAALELADICTQLEKYEEAEKAYKDALKMSKGELDKKHQYHWGLFICYLTAKNWDGCKKAWDGYVRAKTDIDPKMKDNIKIIFLLAKLGNKWAPHNHESKNYIVHTDVSESFAKDVAEQCEIAYKMYAKVFKHKRTGDKFHVHIFSSKQGFMSKTGAPSNAGGFFAGYTEALYMPGSSNTPQFNNTLFHEGFHQFLNTITDSVPTWFNEGHATFFGPSQYFKEGGRPKMKLVVNRNRCPAIKRAMQNGQCPTLGDLLYSGQLEWSLSSERPALYYAAAWSFVYFCWFYEGGKYKKIVTRALNCCKKEEYGRKLVKKAFKGFSISKVQAEWYSYIKKLK